MTRTKTSNRTKRRPFARRWVGGFAPSDPLIGLEISEELAVIVDHRQWERTASKR